MTTEDSSDIQRSEGDWRDAVDYGEKTKKSMALPVVMRLAKLHVPYVPFVFAESGNRPAQFPKLLLSLPAVATVLA